MTPVEERLSELMHQAAPAARPVNFETVARRVQRRRFASFSVVAAVLSAAIVAISLGVAGSPRTDVQRVTASPTASASVAERPRSVAFQGVNFALPKGWSAAPPACYPRDHTVVVGTWNYDCPARLGRLQPVTSVNVTAVYGPQFALSWYGTQTVWHGQPAWQHELTKQGLTTVTLTLPWLNAAITAQSPSAALARSLIGRVSIRRRDGLDVPAGASTIVIQSLAGRDGDGQSRDAIVRLRSDVARLLADLRSLPVVDASERACDGSWWPSTALLTVSSAAGDRTYAARFDECGLIVGGTGSAASVSTQLLADVRRLVPNSGL
jgi:hypothetical protein